MEDFESQLIHRAQSAEAKIETQRQSFEAAIARVKEFKTNMGLKERSDGTLVFNFDKLVDGLGLEQCIELRRIIDERYNISGAPGEKPRVRLNA